MANGFDPRFGASPISARARTSAAAYDAGLRAYMLSVYNYMASAVLLTGIIAMAIANTSAIELLVNVVQTPRGYAVQPTMLGFIAMLAPLGFGLPLSFSRGRMQLSTLQFLFWGYAVTLGISFSTLFIAFTGESIAAAFFAAAAGFAGLSLVGYTTKRDLMPFGTFLTVGVFGLIGAMIVNMFIGSQTMDLVISVIGVGIFAGLAAFHTQAIKLIYDDVAGTEMEGKVAVMGAFRLYVTFVNLFLFLLRLMGSSRN